MEVDEKNLAKLKKLFAAMDEDSLTREEFVKHFETVVKLIENLKKTNENEFNLIHKNFDLMVEEIKDDANSMEKMYKEHKTMMAEKIKDDANSMEKMYKEHKTMMETMDKKKQEIKDGKDADEEKIIKSIKSQIKIPTIEEIEKDLPKLGKEIRDSLELLQENERLDVSAIKGLMEKLEEIKQIKSTGKVFGASVIHKFIDDETPTGAVNGINKDFVLSKSPLGLKVYKGGARQRITEDYTLSNKTITFITAPVVGEIILCDYRHY